MCAPYAGYDQSEDRKRLNNFNFGNLQLHFRSKALNSAGLRQSFSRRDFYIEALQRLEILDSAGPCKADNSYSYMTECLHRSRILQDDGLQTSDVLYSHSSNDSTHPPFEGTQGINPVLKNALQALILLIWVLLKFAGKYSHVITLMFFLTLAACTDVQVPINCTNGAVITSPNYPATYPRYKRKEWTVTAPEVRRILLTFNNFSLGALDDVEVIDVFDYRNRQSYSGEEKTVPPFLSSKNRLILRFTSNGNPTGNGFNISASCYELSASIGSCNQTDDVMNGSWDSNITWYGSIVHLTCDDGYTLNGSGTLQCITEAFSYLYVWNGSIPTCEMDTDTLPVTSGPDNAGIAISSSMPALLICIICAAAVLLLQ